MNHRLILLTSRFDTFFQCSIIKTVFILIILISGINASGQNSRLNIDGYSINPKFGPYNWTIIEYGSFLGGAEFNVTNNKFIYSIDIYKYFENLFFGSYQDENFKQIGLMIGKYKGDNIFRFQYQAGLAPTWGLKRERWITEDERYEMDKFFTIGLTTKLGFKFIPLKFLSIGIDIQTNLNPVKMVYMPMFSIEIGKLRD